MESSELIEYLKKYPRAIIMFKESVHYPDELVNVDIEDFTYTSGRIILHNLCKCHPEPD